MAHRFLTKNCYLFKIPECTCVVYCGKTALRYASSHGASGAAVQLRLRRGDLALTASRGR